MATSILLAAFVAALGIFLAWAVVHFGRKYGEPEKKLRLLAVLFVGGGLLGGVYAFVADWGLRRTTLFERLVEGSEATRAGEDAPVRTMTFDVEHPGVEHTLLVVPRPAFAEHAGGAVDLHVRLVPPEGEALLDVSHTFETRIDGAGAAGRGAHRRIWDSATWRFTPQVAGMHTLELTLLTVGVHEVHVRVEDPEKTDGVRAPGY